MSLLVGASAEKQTQLWEPIMSQWYILWEILASSSLPAETAAAGANDDDEANDEEDDAYTVYPGLQFCASPYTDRIYLYTKVLLK